MKFYSAVHRRRRRFIVLSTKKEKEKKKRFSWLTSFALQKLYFYILYTYSGIPTRDPPAYGFCKLPTCFFLSIWFAAKYKTKRNKLRVYEVPTVFFFLNICFSYFFFIILIFYDVVTEYIWSWRTYIYLYIPV